MLTFITSANSALMNQSSYQGPPLDDPEPRPNFSQSLLRAVVAHLAMSPVHNECSQVVIPGKNDWVFG